MSKIRKYVEMVLSDVALRDSETKVRFSVNIDPIVDFRLQYIAKLLNTPRATLAADFISLAVEEAEEQLGLNPGDVNSSYGKAVKEFFEKTISDPEHWGKPQPITTRKVSDFREMLNEEGDK